MKQKISINFLDFEMKYIYSGLDLLEKSKPNQQQNIRDLREYIKEEVNNQTKITWI